MTIESTSFRENGRVSPESLVTDKAVTCCIGSRRKYDPGTHRGKESFSFGFKNGALIWISTFIL